MWSGFQACDDAAFLNPLGEARAGSEAVQGEGSPLFLFIVIQGLESHKDKFALNGKICFNFVPVA